MVISSVVNGLYIAKEKEWEEMKATTLSNIIEVYIV